MSKPKLTYNRIADSMIEINLNNGFYVMAAYKTIEKEKYNVSLYIRQDDVYMYDLMDDKKDGFTLIELEATYKTICPTILKEVSNLFYTGKFEYYISRYLYMMKCFDKGSEIVDKEFGL